MIRSMTAFARTEQETPAGIATWELRSVNHRYLEAVFRLPEDWRALEPTLREATARRLRRGKLEAILRLGPVPGQPVSLHLQEAALEALLAVAERVAGRLRDPAPIDPLAVLAWPGVLGGGDVDTEAVREALLAGYRRALDILVETREREGARLAASIRERLDRMRPLVDRARRHMPEVLEGLRRRLRERVAEAVAEPDAERLEQELVYLAQKFDVAEELDRLDHHIEEVERVLTQDQPVGRRLDFLMQELHREANTLGAKAASAEITDISVELKVLIEQMREQVQNIE
ncbi:MAG: YicC family protein [Gammaproteobacteria bacterium]|nr:MAG: YicC family protein [Gammaproteobacteria bacterium]